MNKKGPLSGLLVLAKNKIKLVKRLIEIISFTGICLFIKKDKKISENIIVFKTWLKGKKKLISNAKKLKNIIPKKLFSLKQISFDFSPRILDIKSPDWNNI